MAAVKKRRRFTPEQRTRMLHLVHGLGTRSAARKLNVSEVTVWAWRRAANGRATARVRLPRNGSLMAVVRREVQAQVQKLVPHIVREEVSQALDSLTND